MSPQQKALVLSRQGNLELSFRSIPSSDAGQLLVKIRSAALNPFDYKITNTDYVSHYPAVLGMDIAGIVEEPGEGVHNFRKGDRVLAHGKFTNDLTAFQQYALTAVSFTAKVSCGKGLSTTSSVTSYSRFLQATRSPFDSAATVPLALDTAIVGLYGYQFGARTTPPLHGQSMSHEVTRHKLL
ncbi:GroES-like protein [Suillus hirtellus]|nr:GroES-like protein [Suillus hirtellus]